MRSEPTRKELLISIRSFLKNLNLEVDFLEGVITSAENIVLGIYNELFDDIKKMGKHLHCVRLNETENNYVEYYG